MNYTQKMASFGILAYSFFTLQGSDVPTSAYERIGTCALQAEDVAVVQQRVKTADAHDPFALYKSDVSLLPVHATEKKRLTFDLLGHALKDTASAAVLMPEAVQELNIICGEPHAPKLTLHKAVDYSLTSFGSVVGARMIAEPTVDVALLQKRQAIIRALLEDETVYKSCEEALLAVKNSEDVFLTHWSQQNPINADIAKLFFFTSKFFNRFNNYPAAFEALRMLNLGTPVLMGGMLVGEYCLMGWIQEKVIRKMHGDLVFELNREHFKKAAHNTGLLVSGISVISFALQAKTLYTLMTFNEKVLKTMQQMMIDTQVIRSQAEKLADLFESKAGASVLKLAQIKNGIHSKNYTELMKLLSKDTFSGEASFFSLMGRAQTAYKYMLEVKDEFAPMVEALGEIDALFAMAKLIKEYKNKNVHYCLVDFVANDTPVISFVEGWNPLINPEVAVTETMAFGKGGIQSLLLTGPHGSGKSSFMREVMYMAVLGQTFGIAPAAACTMTPFAKLSTYLNIKEDYSQNLSTFMAERKRVDEIRDIINNLQRGEFSLSIMDEVFKGTMEEEGSKRVHRFGKEIADSQQSICLMATHFNYPTILEKDTNGVFVNYHVGLQEHDNGHFTRLFKLIKGKNQWWFDDSVKRDSFIEWLQTVAR